MRGKVISVLCSGFTFSARAASVAIEPIAPANICDLDYQIDAQWSLTPRLFDVTLRFDMRPAQLARDQGADHDARHEPNL